MDFTRGMRDKLDKYVNVTSDIELVMSVNGSSEYDYCCFGVDANNKLSDDRYMVFYNQTSSPNSEIIYVAGANQVSFKINLSRLPESINKLVFTVSIDGNGSMGQIAGHTVAVKQNGNEAFRMSLGGSDFTNEKAIISMEMYRKDGWRVSAVAKGFDGGLSALLAMYGGEECNADGSAVTQQPAPAPAPTPTPTPIPAPAPQPKPSAQDMKAHFMPMPVIMTPPGH